MTTSIGGAAVRNGYYWNLGKWQVIPVARDGEQLPGGPAEKYLRLPLLAVVMLLPVMGALFVVFLPFIGFFLTFQAALRPVVGLFRRTAEGLAATVTPGWQPGEAHFTGKRAEESKEEKGPPAKDQALEKLQREIEEKRGQE
jgi:hypothetical protein